MRRSRRVGRLLAMLVGLGMTLGGAVLLAQDPPPDVGTPKQGKTRPKRGAPKAGPKKGHDTPGGPSAPDAGEAMPDSSSPKARRRRGQGRGATAKGGTAGARETPEGSVATEEPGIKFTHDIAPILVGNCIGCHNPTAKKRNGGLDLSTFKALMVGGKSGPVVVAGKPEESRLVELVTAREMPRGNRGKLSEEAVARIGQWVKDGALLDATADPAAPLEKLAPTPEQIRRDAVAKLSPEQRDKTLEAVGRERWKKSGAKAQPVVSPGKSFLLLSNLPKERVDRLLKTMEAQRTTLVAILGRAGSRPLAGPEKVSLYVFNDLPAYVEFVRGAENREVEPGVETHGRLDVEQPYIAAADPFGGGPEPKASAKKAGKPRRAATAETPDGPERTLAGVLSEPLAASAAAAAGKPPRWLTSGLGAYLASQVDPRGSRHYDKLRRKAAQQFNLGWQVKANEALGGEADPEVLRALGFSLCEWQASMFRAQFPSFVRNMLQGGEKLDEAIRASFGEATTREQFLTQWGAFVATRYEANRRR